MILTILRNWRAIAMAAALGGAFYAAWHVRGMMVQVNDLRASLAQKTALLGAYEKAIKDARKRDKEYEAQRQMVAANLAVADGQLDRLRADLAQIGIGGDSGTPSSPDAARIAGILGECSGEVVRLAGEADELAAKVTGLQAWVMDVAPQE